MPIANVYIDGFNLYRGSLVNSPYKWLDIAALARNLFPQYRIQRVRYFTTRIKGDPAANQRQNTYLRALRTLVGVEIHDGGTFTTHTVIRPLATRPARGMSGVLEAWTSGRWRALPRPASRRVRVSVEHRTEKGSDVDLATYLVADAFQRDMEEAFVISGDSDFETPIRLVNSSLLPVGVVNPTSNRPSAQLQAAAASYRTMPVTILATSQLPDPVRPVGGRPLSKPATW